jgi:DNA repair protein RadB
MNLQGEPSGSRDLDALIGTGYPKKMITQIYGEPGCGKSAFCLLAAVEVLKTGRTVIYIDTESFSVDRFSQIGGAEAEALAERLFLYEPTDFDQQAVMISNVEKLLKDQMSGIIILDSATSLYRTEREHMQENLQQFNKMMIILLGYAKRFNVPVLITNQVYMDINKGDFAPLGGTGLFHLSKVILRIDRIDSVRRIKITKHHAKPEGEFFDFLIVQEGIRLNGS